MGFQPLPRERNISQFDTRDGFFFLRTPSIGLPIAYPAAGAEALTCKANEVALIDEITITSVTEDAATNHDVTLRINGVDLPFHFPGTANLQHVQQIRWRPRGNLVVQPGQTFTAKAETATLAHLVVRGRKRGLQQAIADGSLRGGATLPQVAASGVTVAATAKQIVAPVAGMSVRILAMVFTGHSFNAAADNHRLGFWDGTTGGTFAAGGATINRVFRMGASALYANPLVIGNTDACIVGPAGYGVYVQASANLATTVSDWVIVYDMIPSNRIDVASTSGTPGATATRKGKFWVCQEAAVTASATDSQLDRFFAAQTRIDTLVKIKGYSQSATALPTLGFDCVGFGLGADGTGITPLSPYGGLGGYMPLTGDGNVPTATAATQGQDDTLLRCNLSRIPAFFAYQVGPGEITNRCQLAWGTFGGDKLQAQDTAGRSQDAYFV